MMVVLALVVIIAGLTFTHLSFVHRLTARSELDKLYNACRFVQQYAQVTGTAQTLHVDISKKVYTFCGRTEQLAPGVEFGVEPGVQGPPSSPTAAITKPTTFACHVISCSATGIIQPGTVYLKETKTKSVYALSSSVAHVSYLRKYRYANNRWSILAP